LKTKVEAIPGKIQDYFSKMYGSSYTGEISRRNRIAKSTGGAIGQSDSPNNVSMKFTSMTPQDRQIYSHPIPTPDSSISKPLEGSIASSGNGASLILPPPPPLIAPPMPPSSGPSTLSSNVVDKAVSGISSFVRGLQDESGAITTDMLETSRARLKQVETLEHVRGSDEKHMDVLQSVLQQRQSRTNTVDIESKVQENREANRRRSEQEKGPTTDMYEELSNRIKSRRKDIEEAYREADQDW
jgi:hypothetical protein